MKAIETTYNGYRFRSRLEARWAIFFDCLKIRWDYETEGFILDNGQYYLPDFWLPGFDCYAEVKPKEFTPTEYKKALLLDHPCLLLDTSVPEIYHGYHVTKLIPDSRYFDGGDWGRVLLSESVAHNRLWFLMGEHAEDYALDTMPEIFAKGARFEHGEMYSFHQIEEILSGVAR